MKIQNQKKKSKGFTLIELLVVIAVIGILAAIIVPRFQGAATAASVATAASNLAAANRLLEGWEQGGGTFGTGPTQLDNSSAANLYNGLLAGRTINNITFQLPEGSPPTVPSGWNVVANRFSN